MIHVELKIANDTMTFDGPISEAEKWLMLRLIDYVQEIASYGPAQVRIWVAR